MTNMTDMTAEELRQGAAERYAEAAASFDRCDTDGFASQAAATLTAQMMGRQAQIVDCGGVAEFLTLFTTTGEWVPSKAIDTRYGRRWMLLDSDGKATGQFLPYLPARRRTLADKGYLEGYAEWPARAIITGGGKGIAGMVSCYIATIKTVPDHTPPTEIVATDRWAD